MKESLQQSGSKTSEVRERLVYLFVDTKEYEYTGDWQWDLHSDAVFCSDVMLRLPGYFEGTVGIIHPDDKAVLQEWVADITTQTISFLQFRIITTYGEIKVLTGRNLQAVKVTSLLGGKLEGEDCLKKEQDGVQPSQKLGWQKRAGEFAERLTAIGTWYYEVGSSAMYYSDEVFRIYGLPGQSLNAHLNTFTPFIHPDDRDAVTEAFAKALSEQLPLHLDYRIVTTNGQEKAVRQATYWEFNDQGGLMLYGTIQDMTEQYEAEQKALAVQYEFHIANRLLQQAEQSARMAHWYVNLLTRKTVYSDSMHRLYDVKQGNQSLAGIVFLNYVHPEDREMVQGVHEKIIQQHTPPDLDYRIIRQDGKVRHLRQRGRLVVYGDGERLMLVTVQDVSAEIVTNQKLDELKQQVFVQQAMQQQAEEIGHIGSWIWEPQTDKLTWSESLYTLLGTKPTTIELTQKHLQRAIHTEDRKKFNDAWKLALAEKKETRFEFRIVRLGETRHVVAQFRLIRYAAKELFVGTLQDITQQTQLQQELELQVKQAASITENMLDCALITDTENTIRVWNRCCERVYGLKKEAVLGKNVFDVFPLLKNETQLGLFNRALAGETISVKAMKSVLQPEYHDLHMIPLRDAENKVTGVLHLLHDVTKERNMQQRLTERLNFIESLVETSVDRILVMDRYMNYLYCNQKAAEFYGLRKEDIIGKNVLEVFPSSVNDPTHDHFRRVLRGETVHIPAIEGISEEHYYEVFLTPIKDEADAVSAVLWIYHDLSSEIKVQKQLRKSNEILNTINAVFIEVDYEYRFKYINPTAELYYKKTKEELFGQVIWDVFPQAVGTKGYDAIIKACTERMATQAEFFSPVFQKWMYMSTAPSIDGAIVFFYDRQDIWDAQQQLQEEHRRLKEAQAIGKIGSFEWNLGTEDVVWSDEMYRINGMESGGRVTIEDTNRLIHPDDYEDLKKVKEQAFAKPGFYQIIHRIVLNDGTLKWVTHQFESVADANGTIVRVHGAVQDITERIKTELEITETRELLQTAINTSLTSFDVCRAIRDEHNKIIDFEFILTNNKFQLPGIDLIGKRFGVVFPGIRQTFVFKKYVQATEEGVPQDFEVHYRHEGYDKWFRIVVVKLGDGFLSTGEDITQRKKVETELFKNLNLLKQAEDIAGMGSWEYRITEDEMEWSEGMYQLFDLKQGSIVKKETYLEYVTKEDRPLAKAFIKMLRDGTESYEDTLTIVTKNGARKVLKVKSVTIKDTKGKPVRVLGVDLDITELVKTGETLKALNRSLDQRNKELEATNDELANFSFIASHDLRGPLRKIHTFSDWLLQRERENLSETGQNYLKRMAASVERMDALIEDVLVLTKLHTTAIEDEEVDLNTILNSVKADLSESIKWTNTILKGTKLPNITGNKSQLQHLFKNLITNAIKFQREGAVPQLTIKSSNTTADEIVANGLNIENGYVKVCFTDNGIGFDQSYSTRIFQIFQRLHARTEYEGTGIGLTICKKVMENHHGTITVESTPGKGSTFCCYFPV